MDIFEDSCDHDSIETLELDRFKSKVREIWQRMLQEAYANNPPEDMDEAHYMEHNALKFADEPQEANEADNLMEMLEELLDSKEELEDVSSEGKAPSYGSSSLKSNNEQGSKEATNYEYNHTSSKTPSDSRSGGKGGSYEGTPSGGISKKKDDKVVTKYQPLIEQIREEIKSLSDRQRIGRRKMRFRL